MNTLDDRSERVTHPNAKTVYRRLNRKGCRWQEYRNADTYLQISYNKYLYSNTRYLYQNTDA